MAFLETMRGLDEHKETSTGYDNIPHYTFNFIPPEGGVMLTFTWDGLFRHDICVSEDGYGEPVAYRIKVQEDYAAPAWAKQKIGQIDECEWWTDEVDGDPTANVLNIFKRICKTWYETVYLNKDEELS